MRNLIFSSAWVVLLTSAAVAQSSLSTFTLQDADILDMSDDGLAVLAKTNGFSASPNKLYFWTPTSGWVGLSRSADGAQVSGDGRVVVSWVVGSNWPLSFDHATVSVYRSGQWSVLPVVGQIGNALASTSFDGSVINASCQYIVPTQGEFAAFGTVRWQWNGQQYTSQLQTHLILSESSSNDGSTFGISLSQSISASPGVWTASDGLVNFDQDPSMNGDMSIAAASPDGNAAAGFWSSEDGSSSGATAWTKSNGVWSRHLLLGHPVVGGALRASIIANNASIIGTSRLIWAGPDATPQTVDEFLTSRGVDSASWTDLQLSCVSADGRTLVGKGNLLGQGRQFWYARLPLPCDTDFNNNGVFPEDQDVLDFFSYLAGDPCPTPSPPGCDSIDVNLNGVFPEDQDVIDFFAALAGDPCGS